VNIIIQKGGNKYFIRQKTNQWRFNRDFPFDYAVVIKPSSIEGCFHSQRRFW